MLRFLRLIAAGPATALLFAGLLTLAAALPQTATAEDVPFGQGLLWRIEKDGTAASYIFGTVHYSDPRLQDLPPQVEQALNEARVAVFELPADPAGQSKMMQAMLLPPGERLEDILGAELFHRVASALAPLGMEAEALQVFKPWGMIIFLGLPPIELARQAQGKPAFDAWLRQQAAQRGKEIGALESYEDQIAVFDGLSGAEQVAFVADLVADYEEIVSTHNRIFRSYLRGNTSDILALASDVSEVPDVAAAERLKMRVLDDRNRKWAEDLPSLLQTGGAFVAVGAAHLPGEVGVLNLLESRGYRITRVY